MVVAAITGSTGLMPVVKAAKKGIPIALANKESLVCSGSLITSIAKQNGSIILPVDSEHNAIFQVLDSKNRSKVSKLILTASGGPFLNKEIKILLILLQNRRLNILIGQWEKKFLLILQQ